MTWWNFDDFYFILDISKVKGEDTIAGKYCELQLVPRNVNPANSLKLIFIDVLNLQEVSRERNYWSKIYI